jgi:nucleotide-binding universal stress UspA family protein
LNSALERAGLDSVEVKTHSLTGDPAFAIDRLADKLGANVIILGPHRPTDAAAAGLGGTALELVTNASVPCLVAPSVLRLPLRRVIVAVDLSDTARGALVTGVSWASALRTRQTETTEETTVTALRIHKTESSSENDHLRSAELDKQLERVRDEAGDWAGVAIESASESNADPAAGIAAYAREHRADLVVMGTRGLGLDATGRIGSVSAAMMERLDVPVLLVPPAVWLAYASSRG